jgi:calcineurin-like phosphoesterase family protein
MEDKSKIWFTADTHFGHKRTLELSKRPFTSVEEMDWSIIRNWNSVVTDRDTVYHLGDVGDFNKLAHLKGDIVLVPGNYDNEYISGGSRVEITKRLAGRKLEIASIGTFLNIDGLPIKLVHEPSKGLDTESVFCLFGHIHKLQMVKRYGLNVGVDCHNFYPIDWDTVLFYRNAILNHYDEEVFC